MRPDKKHNVYLSGIVKVCEMAIFMEFIQPTRMDFGIAVCNDDDRIEKIQGANACILIQYFNEHVTPAIITTLSCLYNLRY